jgi:hypothetical protein
LVTISDGANWQAVTLSESVAASYSLTGNGTTVASGTVAAFTTTIGTFASQYDTHSAFSTSTGTFTVPVAGKYRVTASALWNVSGSFGTQGNGFDVHLELDKNGSISGGGVLDERRPYTSESFPSTRGSMTVLCAAGDTLTPKISQTNSGGTANSLINNGVYNYVMIEKISN